MLLLGDIIRRHARHRGAKIAYVIGERRVSYAALDARANRVAHVLAAHGVRHGDRVAVLASNDPEYPVLYFAAARLGAILVPVNTRFHAAEVRFILAHSESSALVYGPECAAVAAEAARNLEHLRHRFTIADAGDGVTVLDDLVQRASDDAPTVRVHEDDPHVMLYTSGTTGDPKGVLCSHRAYHLQAGCAQAANGLTSDDVGVSMFPMFHMGGWSLPLGFWHNGGTAILTRRADPETLLGAIAGERATYFYAVPTVYSQMLEAPGFGAYDLSSLRRIGGGTAAMTAEHIRAITDRFGTTNMSIAYGSTEAGSVGHLDPSDLFRKPTSVGRPAIGVDVRTIRADGTDCATEEAGEIVVRSEFVMRGYWNDPEATAATIRDGWVHTGDLGAFDGDGFLHIAGRLKEMIKSGGENIFPAEIERTLMGHPKIREVAVLGVPDPRWTETPLAAVVLHDGATMTEAEVIAYVRERLAPFKRPRHVRFVDSLPRTASTRQVQKPLLRELLLPTLRPEATTATRPR
jgi:acyl-CoA synthetase (AMP-forming)/AMP-acid ligase II